MRIEIISLEEWYRNLDVNVIPLLELPFSIEEAQRRSNVSLELYWRDGLGQYLGATCRLGSQQFIFQGPVATPELGACVEMLSTEAEPKTLLDNICKVFDVSKDDLVWVNELLDPPKYIVTRLDDNGNEIEMKRFHLEDEAHWYAKKYKERGHKQIYSVKTVK